MGLVCKNLQFLPSPQTSSRPLPVKITGRSAVQSIRPFLQIFLRAGGRAAGSRQAKCFRISKLRSSNCAFLAKFHSKRGTPGTVPVGGAIGGKGFSATNLAATFHRATCSTRIINGFGNRARWMAGSRPGSLGKGIRGPIKVVLGPWTPGGWEKPKAGTRISHFFGRGAKLARWDPGISGRSRGARVCFANWGTRGAFGPVGRRDSRCGRD